MGQPYKLMEEVMAVPLHELGHYAEERAACIVCNTQGDSLGRSRGVDGIAVELAHAYMRLRNEGLVK
jgi:hypothetical protein